MNPPLHPSSIFFLLVPFFISINIPTSLCADDIRYTNCSSHFSCGTITNVSYPFWGENRADYCGQRNFQLKCEDDVPKIIINSITYRILNFTSTEQKLTVVMDDYWENICVSEHKNITLDSSFKYVAGLTNLTLLYNCGVEFKPMSQFFNSSCKDGSDTSQNVYYGSEDSGIDLQGICTAVIIPIFQAYISEALSNRMPIQDAIDSGFGFYWDVDDDQCNSCVSSGGQCGYSQTQEKFTCLCKDGPQGVSCSGSSSRIKMWPIIAIGVSAAGVGIVIISVIIIFNRNRHSKLGQKMISKVIGTSYDHHVETFMESYGTLAPRRYTYSEVKRMTNSFSKLLGQGGYGIVYKATMPDDRLVAIKVLSESKGNGEEFINEVASISRTSHVNIVSLLGFCYEKNGRALIYEFMPNGSLDKFIYKGDSPNAICNLEWLRMYQIAIGIARGLEYLHRGCNTRILHLDIKPQNILLDEDFCPKISDFGLAKIFQKKESIVSILGTRGTVGYIAPEVFSRTFGKVSYKSDVYSYGMLVLEMIGGRKNFESGGSNTSEMYFPDWIYKDLEQENFLTRGMSITEEENEIIRKMTLVSLWCIQTNPLDRPSTTKVVEMLEGTLQSLPFPPKPYLYSPPRPPTQFSGVPFGAILDTNSSTTPTDVSLDES